MRNLRAIILLIWRIWACYNSRRIMRVAVPTRVVAVWWRIFCVSVGFSDCCRCHDCVGCARVNALRVKSRAYYKEPSQNGCQDFQRIFFHIR